MKIEQQLYNFIGQGKSINEIYNFARLIKCKYGTIERKARLLTEKRLILPEFKKGYIIAYHKNNIHNVIIGTPTIETPPKAQIKPNLPRRRLICKYSENNKCLLNKECRKCLLAKQIWN